MARILATILIYLTLFLFPLLAQENGATSKPVKEAPAPKPPELSANHQTLMDNISAEEMKGYLSYLASDELEGRGSGTKGEKLAGEYIAKHFEKHGLKPLGDNGTYFQSFEITTGHKYFPDNHLKVDYRGIASEFKIKEDFVPFSFSGDGAIETQVVFAGYGITNPEAKYDDYANIDVKGKIVLVLRREPVQNNKPVFGSKRGWSKHAEFATKAKNAQEHGAAGIIIFNDPLTVEREGDHLMPMGGFGRKLKIPAIHLRGSVGDSVLMAMGMATKDLQNELNVNLKPNSFLVEDLKIHLKAGIFKLKSKARNVVGFLAGTDPVLKDEIVIVGGHYDHLGKGEQGGSLARNSVGKIHNGADDNASGSSGVLSLVKALSKIETRKRSLLFLSFSGEERGLIGSNYYANHPTVALEKCVAMLNMDMIGRMNNKKLEVGGIGTSPSFETEIKNLNGLFNFKLSLNKAGRGPSDHTSFYVKNIPVLFFFTGTHKDYHKPSDDVDKINFSDAERVAEMVSFQALDLLNRETRPTFQKATDPNPQGKQRGRSRVQLGIMPGYGDEEKGVAITDVVEGKPAELGGMKGGDRIIKMNERDIENIYDLMDVLSKANPGDEMRIKVIRDGKEIIVIVKLVGR